MQTRTIEQQSIEAFPAVQPAEEPTILLLPGIHNSGPDHWQSRWELLPNFKRVQFGNWSHPKLHDWVPMLDQSIRDSSGKIVLVAHSLGCLAATWWATLCWDGAGDRIAGALLVAPPDVDRVNVGEALRDFRPVPTTRLPFRAMVVASQDDPYASIERSREMAQSWGCDFIDAGAAGHINAESRLGIWATGLQLISELTGRSFNRLVAELTLRAALV